LVAHGIDDIDIARWRMRSLRLVSPLAGSAGEVVGALLAVQAENAVQAAWAVGCRTAAADPGDLAALLADGTVIRTHVLRPTWHFVCADDVAWLLDLTGPRVQKVTGGGLRLTHGLDDAAIERAMTQVVDVLAGHGELTRAALRAELTQREVVGRTPPPGGPDFLMLLLAHAELAGLIGSGRPVDGEHVYALLADRAPGARRLDREEALAELAFRYACGHGPVTERDLAYWATLTLGAARRGLASVAARLDRFEHDGRTFWHAPGESPPPLRGIVPRAHLLQILDECYRGYQDTRWMLDAAGIVPRGREASTGMALIDGQFAAQVRRTDPPGRVRFALRPYRQLGRGEIAALQDTAHRYAQFTGRSAELTVQALAP
jgi:hypothetical protein